MSPRGVNLIPPALMDVLSSSELLGEDLSLPAHPPFSPPHKAQSAGSSAQLDGHPGTISLEKESMSLHHFMPYKILS